MSDTPDHVPPAAVPRPRHWDAAYAGRGEQQVSWYQADPHVSAGLIGDHAATMAAGKDSAIIDAGGGGSLLAARLVATGFTDVTVLDVSRAALTAAARRPGGAHVTWIHADLLDWQPARRYHIWHDRAVFHFLTSPGDRAAYLATLRAALAGGGAIVLATFAAGLHAAQGYQSPATTPPGWPPNSAEPTAAPSPSPGIAPSSTAPRPG